MPLSPEPDSAVRAARALAMGGLLGLIALCLAWELWLAPTGSGTLALKALPLMFCVAGLARHRMYTFRWLSLLLWLYFLEGVVRATSERGIGAALAMAEIVLSLSLFGVAGFYIRWRLRRGRLMAAQGAAIDTPSAAQGAASDHASAAHAAANPSAAPAANESR